MRLLSNSSQYAEPCSHHQRTVHHYHQNDRGARRGVKRPRLSRHRAGRERQPHMISPEGNEACRHKSSVFHLLSGTDFCLAGGDADIPASKLFPSSCETEFREPIWSSFCIGKQTEEDQLLKLNPSFPLVPWGGANLVRTVRWTVGRATSCSGGFWGGSSGGAG
jgi:hypothetical protein